MLPDLLKKQACSPRLTGSTLLQTVMCLPVTISSLTRVCCVWHPCLTACMTVLQEAGGWQASAPGGSASASAAHPRPHAVHCAPPAGEPAGQGGALGGELHLLHRDASLNTSSGQYACPQTLFAMPCGLPVCRLGALCPGG